MNPILSAADLAITNGTNALNSGADTAPFGIETPDFLNPGRLFGAVLYGLIIALLALLLGRLVRLAVHRALSHSSHIPADPTATKFLGQLARAGVYVIAFLTYAHLVPALRGIGTSWLASLGVASVVLGLAAQNTLGNLIAGISLLLYRPFVLGDRIQVNSPTGVELGEVESLTLGYTVLRTPDSRRVVIPNSVMASQTSINLSSAHQRMLAAVAFIVPLGSDLDRVRAILLELTKEHSGNREFASCAVTAVAGGNVTLTLKAWCPDFQDANDFKFELLEAAARRFPNEKIELR